MSSLGHDETELTVCNEIGQGQCGTIYAITGTPLVIKLPNLSAKYDELFRDAQVHGMVQEALNYSKLKPHRFNFPRLGSPDHPTILD